MYSSLVNYRWSPGHAKLFQNVINHLKEDVALNEVIVYKID